MLLLRLWTGPTWEVCWNEFVYTHGTDIFFPSITTKETPFVEIENWLYNNERCRPPPTPLDQVWNAETGETVEMSNFEAVTINSVLNVFDESKNLRIIVGSKKPLWFLLKQIVKHSPRGESFEKISYTFLKNQKRNSKKSKKKSKNGIGNNTLKCHWSANANEFCKSDRCPYFLVKIFWISQNNIFGVRQSSLWKLF